MSPSPPKSPKTPTTTVITTKAEHAHFTKSSSSTTNYAQIRFRGEDNRSKMKIPGLSSLQQRVLSLNDDDTDNSFKSLTEFSDANLKISKPVIKSHSFKTIKNTPFNSDSCDLKCITKSFIEKEQKDDSQVHITKAASLDSIKNLEGQMHTSQIELDLKRNPFAVEADADISKPLYAETNTECKDLEESNIFRDSTITISGPSHTAIVNVTGKQENYTTSSKNHTFETTENITDNSHSVNIKEHQVSVTKIQVKRESTQVTQSTVTIPKSTVPEFLSKHLNKVEARPTSNVILSMKSPKLLDEPIERPKTLFNFEVPLDVVSKPPTSRKFSKENLEIIEKSDKDEEMLSKTPPIVTTSSVTQINRFKKNDVRNSNRKSSIVSISPDSPITNKPSFKTRSASLDSLKSEMIDSDKSSQGSLDNLDDSAKEKETTVIGDTVVLRRKSLANKKTEEEPELMKVFARRSLKLKDSEIDAIQDNLLDKKTRDSDKENQMDSPIDDRKKSFNKSQDSENELISRRKSLVKEQKKEDFADTKTYVKEILVENKVAEISKNNKDMSPGSPPTLRRTFNNNIFLGQRAVSLNPSKTTSSELILKKQITITERRITDQWITNNEDTQIKEKLIDEILPQTDFITEPKNFSQRKAEWEKRAQQAAQKKNTP